MKKKRVFGPIRRKRGWGFFTLGMGLSLLIGLGLRSVLNAKSVDHWLQSQIIQQGLSDKVQYKNVDVSFHKSSLPRIGIYFGELTLKFGGGCGSSKVILENVYLPLSSLNLAKGKLSLGLITADRGEWFLQACVRNAAKEVSEDYGQSSSLVSSSKDKGLPSLKNESKSSLQVNKTNEPVSFKPSADFYGGIGPVKNYFGTRWREDWEKWSKKVVGLDIKELKVFDSSTLRRWVTVRGARIELSDDGVLELESRVQPEDFVFGGVNVRPFSIRAQFSSELAELNINGLFQEGRINAFWKVFWEKDLFDWEISLGDFPLRGVASTYHQWWKDDIPLNLKNVWLSCNLKQKGILHKWKSVPIDLSNCQAYGNGGKIHFDSMSASLATQNLTEPFTLKLENLSLEHFVQVVGKSGPMGVFNSLGRAGGALTFQSFDELEGVVILKDMELAFSNRGVHGKQKVNQVLVRLSLKEDRFSGLVDSVQLEDGLMGGDISFNFDKYFKEGVAQVKVNELTFSPSIQKLMVGGTLSGIELYGQAKIVDGEVHDWRGGLGLAEMGGEDWLAKGLKIKTVWLNNKLNGELGIRQIELKKENRFFQLMKPMFLDQSDGLELMQWEGLVSGISLDNDGGIWQNLEVNSSDPKLRISSNGKWLRDRELSGKLEVSLKGLPKLEWVLSGDWYGMRLLPSYNMIKTLAGRAKKQPEMKQLRKSWIREFVKKQEGVRSEEKEVKN